MTNRTGTLKQPYGYRGYQYDEDAKLYYLNARYYDPDLARFISEDTYRGDITDPLSLNRYTYCSNNPIRYIDPSGYLQWEKSDENLDEKYQEMLKDYISIYEGAKTRLGYEGISEEAISGAEAEMAFAESLATAIRRIARRHEAYKKQAYKSYEINKKEVNDNLTGEWGDENVWGVGYFDSADEAAQDFAENYYGITAYAGIEIGTLIYPVVDQDGNVKYTYMLPTAGTCGSVDTIGDLQGFLPLETKIITGMELTPKEQAKYDAMPEDRKQIYDQYREQALLDMANKQEDNGSLRVSIAHTHPDIDTAFSDKNHQFILSMPDRVAGDMPSKDNNPGMDIYMITANTRTTDDGRSEIQHYSRHAYLRGEDPGGDNPGRLVSSFQYRELSDEQKEALRYRYGDVYQATNIETHAPPITGDDFLTGNYDAKKRKDYEEILNELFSIK